jgi:hypothetical protein
MIIRAIDADGDWLFGKGKNDYYSGNFAVAENIKTRLLEFLGNCFWNTSAGIDWFNLLGTKNINALILAIRTIILNSENVSGITELSVVLDRNRNLRIVYVVSTVFPGHLSKVLGFLLTEDGDILTTEDGEKLELG